MNIEQIKKAIYDLILLIISYFTDIFKKQKEEIKEEIVQEIHDTKTYDESFNDKQICIEEVAEEVIEKILLEYHLFKKD
tara:strand:+ start:2160 stop:2396 length:237 start_codon:yes stop_codon:yes gene_type:complete